MKKKSREGRKILQIMPANRWHLKYEIHHDDEQIVKPLTAWALVEDGESFYTVGMVIPEGELVSVLADQYVVESPDNIELGSESYIYI